MRHELDNIAMLRTFIELSETMEQLEDIAQEMVGHSEHEFTDMFHYREFLLEYCDAWECEALINAQ